jgi:trehalose 6-phosphate synthase
MSPEVPLVLVSNRGPATFEDGEPSRGGGGLVTALTGLVNHRDAVWVASAMSEGDVEMSRRHDGASFDVELDEAKYRVKLVESDDQAYDRFYNVVANPLLWFIQHYLWDLSNAPDIRRAEVEAYQDGYCAVNEDLARAVLDELKDVDEAVVMLHDYHLYVAPKLIRAERPDLFLHHFVHIPWTQPDAWRVLPADMREDIYEGILANDIIAFHTRSYQRNFLLCCRELFDLEVDEDKGIVRFEDREVWVRSYPLPISAETFHRTAQRPAVHQYEREILRRRREHLILRVDRADLSKNVLRGFTAFDMFLEQHPEFAEQVTFIAHLIPSRQDVPEYAEYLERIEALVGGGNPPPRHHGLDADRPAPPREPRGGDRGLQALRPAHGQRDVRRDEPDRQGGALGQRAQRRLAAEREHGRPRGAGRLRLVGEPVRRPGPGRRHPPRAFDVRRGALVARAGAQANRDRPRSGGLGRRPAGGHRLQAPRRGGGARVGPAVVLGRPRPLTDGGWV